MPTPDNTAYFRPPPPPSLPSSSPFSSSSSSSSSPWSPPSSPLSLTNSPSITWEQAFSSTKRPRHHHHHQQQQHDKQHHNNKPAAGMISAIMQSQAIRRRAFPAIVLFVIFFIWLVATFTSPKLRSSTTTAISSAAKDVGGSSHKSQYPIKNGEGKTDLHRVAKVSMLYGKPNPLYERAIKSHYRHAERWGLDMHVLRQDIAVGFWNKPSYLLSLIVQELAKHPEERVEWLMWVDADSIILNPNIPVEIFIPPSDLSSIHMVATRDHNGLNTGIIFLHVHPWTVTMLTESLGYPLLKPEVDLGRSADQESMSLVLKKATGGPGGYGYRKNLIYIPRTLINAYEFHHRYEGEKGNLLVHFPGLEEDRWPHMAKWLDVVEANPREWEVHLEDTDYLMKTKGFWEQVRSATRAIADLKRKMVAMPNATGADIKNIQARRSALLELDKALYEQADDLESLQERYINVKSFLD